eukprot:5761123-Prymnesium_polylepis.1
MWAARRGLGCVARRGVRCGRRGVAWVGWRGVACGVGGAAWVGRCGRRGVARTVAGVGIVHHQQHVAH